jgi:hypothetical protein
MSRVTERVIKHTLRGTVQQVDLANRLLILRTQEAQLRIDVALTCRILINSERARLHMLQPADRVTVAVEESSGGQLARQIELNSLA